MRRFGKNQGGTNAHQRTDSAGASSFDLLDSSSKMAGQGRQGVGEPLNKPGQKDKDREKEKQEREKQEKEKQERERLEQEKLERERQEREKREREQRCRQQQQQQRTTTTIGAHYAAPKPSVPPTLYMFITRTGRLPQERRGSVWLDTGDVILVAQSRAFRFHKHVLAEHSDPLLALLRLALTDDSAPFLDGCPVVEVPDREDDFGYFLRAILRKSIPPLWTRTEFAPFAGILRMATKYGVADVRKRAISILEERYPAHLAAWEDPDRARLTLRVCDHVEVINLARQTDVWSVMPAAFAYYAESSSTGEVFGARMSLGDALHGGSSGIPTPPSSSPSSPTTPTPLTPTQDQPVLHDAQDAETLSRVREHNHRSIVLLLKLLSALGSECTRPPDYSAVRLKKPRNAGMAPVGARGLELGAGASLCKRTFGLLAGELALEAMVCDVPVGYDAFVRVMVRRVRERRAEACVVCLRAFEAGVRGLKEAWWDGVRGFCHAHVG